MQTRNKLILAQICRVITLTTLIFTIILGLDTFLPTLKRNDSVEHVSLMRNSRFRGSSYSTESITVRTKKHSFPAHFSQYANMQPGTQIEIEATPILGIVKQGFLPIKQIHVSVHTGILDTFWWFPIILFLTSLVGFLLRKDITQAINFGQVNFILLLIVLKLMRVY